MTNLPTRIRLGPVAQELAQAKAGDSKITQQHLDDAITELKYAASQASCPLHRARGKSSRWNELLLIAEIGSETDPS